MKKFVNELDAFQLMIYEHLKKEVENEENLVSALMEIEEGFECVPDRIYKAYASMKPIERVELIHFFTKYLMRKNS